MTDDNHSDNFFFLFLLKMMMTTWPRSLDIECWSNFVFFYRYGYPFEFFFLNLEGKIIISNKKEKRNTCCWNVSVIIIAVIVIVDDHISWLLDDYRFVSILFFEIVPLYMFVFMVTFIYPVETYLEIQISL